MKRRIRPLLLLALSGAILNIPARLHAAESTPVVRTITKGIDPKALAYLQQMSNTLSSAPALTCTSNSISQVPAVTGQFLTFFSTTELALKRPDKLRAHVAGEAPHFDFYYDGSVAAASAPGTNVYSISKAPPTIDAMLSGLEKETGIRLITAPLFFSNPYAVLTKGLTSAVVVGPVTVRGTPCIHLAFRSPGVDWEIWIASGTRAVPLRMAVTFTDRPGAPRSVAEFSKWNLHPLLGNNRFVFHKPAGAKEIPFLAVMKSRSR